MRIMARLSEWSNCRGRRLRLSAPLSCQDQGALSRKRRAATSAPVLDDAASEPDLDAQQGDHAEQEPVPELLAPTLLRQLLQQPAHVVLVGEGNRLANRFSVGVAGRRQVGLAWIGLHGVQGCLTL